MKWTWQDMTRAVRHRSSAPRLIAERICAGSEERIPSVSSARSAWKTEISWFVKARRQLKYGKVYGKVSQCSELKRILFDILPTPIHFRHLERVRKSASGPEISWSSKQPEITDDFSKQPFVKGIFTTHKTPVSACFAFQVGICCFLLRLACCILFGAFLAPRHCVELQQLHWIGGDTERCGFASLEQCQCSPGCNRSLDQHESAGSMESTERWRLG